MERFQTPAAIIGRLFLVFILSSGLPGCKTTDGGSGPQTDSSPTDSAPAAKSYTFFNDQGDHLRELAAANKLEEAALLYTSEKAFFDEKREKYAADLKGLADGLNRTRAPALATALGSLRGIPPSFPRESWAGAKTALAAAVRALENYDSLAMLQEPDFRANEAGSLRTLYDETTTRLRDQAPAAFEAFRHFGDTSFFDAYPIDLDPPAFMAAHFDALQGKLATAGTSQLERFLANYPKDMLGASYDRLSGLYFEALTRQTSKEGTQSLRVLLANLNHAAKRGFSASAASSLKIGFVEATSKTLLREKQIDFPAEIEVDLPVETVALKLDQALSNDAGNPDYIIIFDVAMAKASRWVQNVEKIRSTYLAGYEEKPNPDYDMAKVKVGEAQSKRTSAQIRSATSRSGDPLVDLIVGLFNISETNAAETKVKEEMEGLKGTPQFIKVPIYNKYVFDKAHMEAKKVMTVNYYVIDRRQGGYFKSTFDVTDDRVFSVIYNVHRDDPDHDVNEASGNTEKDVTEWEDAPLDVKLSLLVDNYLANQGKTRKLPKLVKLREELLKDKNRALANYDENRYGFTTGNDPRFDSVVVVYNPDGGMGTGFYVRPDIVLTNWHVVEGSKFVEMALFDKQETFGKVINTDVRLDLALVKVQNRGKPVTFFNKKTLKLGTTLDAIGHPNRHKFTITRGILSAVRKMPNINIPGGDKVIYIQTDTPISPGNSGGPLFYKNKVVGVNTFKTGVTDGYENLNFSVHYSEVKNFIKKSLGGSFEEEPREPME